MTSNRSVPLLMLLDAKTNIAAIDAPLAARLGYRRSELIGQPFSRLVPPDHLTEVGGDLVAIVTGVRSTATRTTVLRLADGSVVDAIVFIEGREDDNGKTGFSMTVRLANGLPAALPDHLRRLHVPAALTDVSGNLVDRNDAWHEMFGNGTATVFELVTSPIRTEFQATLERLDRGAARTTRLQAECRTVRGPAWCRLSLATLAGSAGMITATAEDVSTEHLTNRVLSANESLFRSLAESSPVGLARLAPDLTITYATPSWRRLTEDDQRTPPRNLRDVLHEDGRDQVLAELHERANRLSDEPVRALVDAGHTRRWVHLRISAVEDDNLGHTGYVATVEDVTDLVAVTDSQSQLAGIVETTSDLVGIGDLRSGTVLYLNAAAQALFVPDGTPAELSVANLYAPKERERYRDEVYPVLRRGETWTGELTMVRHDGSEVRVLQTVAAEIGPDGEPERASVLGRDVSNERQVLEELAYKATHDHLTGLPNRSLLIDHLELALARSARDRTPVAVLFIDLDRFKVVNDTFGHDVGDELLREVSARMSTVLRPSDTVARLGGDEFVVVCDDIEGDLDALTIAGRIRASIEDEPLVIRGHEMDISASVGIAMSNGGSTRDPDTLLKRADTAMYRAKNSGRARTEIFDAELRDRTRRRVEMSGQLREAIDAGALELYYQPIVDLRSGQVAAVEAFVRWPHPDQGLLTPAEFLAIAAETGLDEHLDTLVIERACIESRRWHRKLGDASPPVHVNVSGPTLLSGTLSQRLDHCLRATGLPPSKLCLELTEQFLMTNGTAKADRVEQIKALGVRLCIDDVGTAATVIPRLSQYGLDVLKIHGDLTREIESSEEARQLVRGVVALGRALGLEVAVETVESPDAIPILRELGADVAQGHVFSMPVPADKIEPLLTLRSALARA